MEIINYVLMAMFGFLVGVCVTVALQDRNKYVVKEINLLLNGENYVRRLLRDWGSNIFSKEMLEVYWRWVKQPERFSLSKHTIDETGSYISLWIANGEEYVKFYTQDEDYEDLCERMNNKLTVYDRALVMKMASIMKSSRNIINEKIFQGYRMG